MEDHSRVAVYSELARLDIIADFCSRQIFSVEKVIIDLGRSVAGKYGELIELRDWL